jgi:hypothetical protein
MRARTWTNIAGRIGSAGAVTFIALAAAASAQCLLDPALSNVAEIGSLEHLRLLVVNALPVACAGLLLFALTARPLLAATLTFTVLATLHAANGLKLLHLGLPLLPADLHFLRGGSGEAGLFARYVSASAMIVPLLGLGATVLALWYERRRPRLALRARGGTALAAMLFGVSLFRGMLPWAPLYDRIALGFEPWTPLKTEAHAGMLPTLLMFRWEMSAGPRPPASRRAAMRMLAEQAASLRDAMQPGWSAAPDIVVVQSESFFDPELLRGMPPGSLPNFRTLAEHGVSGNLTVPTFGGGTVRTEFEVLTGLALKFFPGVEYPYFELVDRALPSLPRTLARSGYQTEAIHPNDAGFWNRAHALHQIGIDHFVAGEAFRDAPKTGLFVADSALTDRILAELKDDGPPQFLFAISMEAHGPYEWRPGLDAERLAALPMPAGLDEYADRTLRNFLYHLDDADRELGRLAAALTARQRPTLLLFYGDHLPGLQAAFAATGFVDGRQARAQPTPWLLLDNSTVAAAHDDLSAWELPVRLLAAAGIHEDAYFALLGTLHEAIATMDDGDDLAFADALGEVTQLRLADQFDEMASRALQDDAPPLPPDDDGPAVKVAN